MVNLMEFKCFTYSMLYIFKVYVVYTEKISFSLANFFCINNVNLKYMSKFLIMAHNFTGIRKEDIQKL